MNDQLKGLGITTLGVLFVVPDALFVRLIDAGPMVITFWRSLLTSLVILAGLYLYYGAAASIQIRNVGKTGLIYSVLAAVSSLLFITSVSLTTVANTVFIIASMPVFAAIFSWFWLGERITRRMLWTIILVMLGLLVISLGTLGGGKGNIWGDLAAVSTACTFAAALTAIRKSKAKSMIPAIPIAYLGLAFVLWFFTDPFDIPAGDWGYVSIHGGFFIAISSCLLVLGPRYITSAEVALLILVESVLAPLLVWFVIGEVPGIWSLIGGAMVLGVLFVSNMIALRRNAKRTQAGQTPPLPL